MNKSKVFAAIYIFLQILTLYSTNELLHCAAILFSFLFSLSFPNPSPFLIYHLLLTAVPLFGEKYYLYVHTFFLLLQGIPYKHLSLTLLLAPLLYERMIPILLLLPLFSKDYIRRSDIFFLLAFLMNFLFPVNSLSLIVKTFVAMTYPFQNRDFAILLLLLPFPPTAFLIFLPIELLQERKPKIIAFVGKKGSGKTLCANYVAMMYDFERKDFAKILKDVCSETFSLSKHELNDSHLKDLRNTSGHVPRRILQKVGFSLRTIHEDVFIDHLFSRWQNNSIAISDCRFLNEAKAIKERGGILIKIERVPLPRDDDVSETELDQIECDHVLQNNGTTTDLHANLKKLLQSYI